jgi:hypothetical protein
MTKIGKLSAAYVDGLALLRFATAWIRFDIADEDAKLIRKLTPGLVG